MNLNDPELFRIVESEENKWFNGLIPVYCNGCSQTYFIDPDLQGAFCPVCLKDGFEIHPVLTYKANPELIIQTEIKENDLEFVYQRFTEKFRFAPDGLTVSNLVSRAVLHYWTMWLVDAGVDGQWKADVGFDYQVKSNVETYKNQTWDSHEVVGTRTRWEMRFGEVHRHYQNISLPALPELEKLTKSFGNFDLAQSEKLVESSLPKTMILAPEISPERVWDLAKTKINKAVENDCTEANGAQHIRSFTLSAEYTPKSWTLLLLPVIANYYMNDEGERVPLYINGQSGKIFGARYASVHKAWSWAGIGFLSAILLLIAGIVSITIGALFPPLPLLGGLLIMAAFAAGVGSIIPVIWVMLNNKQEKEKYPSVISAPGT